MTQNLAILSDIHANRFALEAVLEDIERHEIDTILNLGDSLFGPLDPEGTFQLISSHNMMSISGNQDRFIVENRHQHPKEKSTLNFVLQELFKPALDWLEGLSDHRIWEDIFLCHGNLTHDDIPLLEKFDAGKVKLKSPGELEEELQEIQQKVVLCGHTHVPNIAALPRSQTYIINPDSVGLPAYDDDTPFYHKMESKTPLAKYLILEMDGPKVATFHQRHLQYNHQRAAKLAKDNGQQDWAAWPQQARLSRFQ